MKKEEKIFRNENTLTLNDDVVLRAGRTNPSKTWERKAPSAFVKSQINQGLTSPLQNMGRDMSSICNG